MLRFALLAGLVLVVALSAQAQTEYPRVELFGGHSYAAVDKRALAFSDARQSASGWETSVSVNFNKHFGITADFAGQYGNVRRLSPLVMPPTPPPPVELFFSTHQFLFGPRLTRRTSRVTAFGHALFGANRTRISKILLPGGGSITVAGQPEQDFAMAFGGGLDINVGRRFSLRAIQADYLPVRARPGPGSSFWVSHLRLQTGAVVKLGGPEEAPATSRLQPEISFPRFEVFGGYSYANVDRRTFPREGLHGWGASANVNLNSYFGFTAGFGGQFGKATARNALACIDISPTPPACLGEVDFSTTQFLFGPRIAGRTKKLTAFGHALFGGNHSRFSSLTTNGSTRPARSETDFALAVGGGLDINLNRRLAVRALQADYLPVRERGIFWLDNLRLQTGVVVKLHVAH